MTHILQATHATWLAYTGNDNPNALGLISPVITVPYDTNSLFMDITIYDQGIAINDTQGKQIQYFINNNDPTKPYNLGSTSYAFDSDFYYSHHNTTNPFTTALGIPVTKNGAAWIHGDTFVMHMLFYMNNPALIVGLSKIRIY